MRNPCARDCAGRSATCHSTCEAYLDFRSWSMMQYEDKLREQKANSYIHDQIEISRKTARRSKR